MMKTAVSARKAARSILSLFLIVLPFWNLAGGSLRTADQQEQATETAGLAITDTPQPSETPSPQTTETSTLTLEAPTATGPAATATEVPATDPPLADQSLGGEFVRDEVLVRFRKRASKESIEQCIQAVNAAILSDLEPMNALVLSVPEDRVAESISHLEACPDLHYAEPNYLVQMADLIPSDPGWGNQYGLTNIRAPQGWEITTGSPSVTIAIVDTGIDYTHPDLAEKIVGGIDIIHGDSDPRDDNGHGTHVAGIAGAISDNGLGVAGVSWGARLMPVKVLNAAGTGTYADVAAGILWAADHGAQVINLSLGGNNFSLVLQDAVDYAASQGVLLVAAAGNTGINFVQYPARYSNVIAVAATDSSNARWGLSNYGPELDLSAPGFSIYSTEPGGYTYRTGTSMAVPYVSGLAAILRGIPGNGSPAAILQQMESAALDLGPAGRDDLYGAGLIQMDAAIQPVWPDAAPTSGPSGSFASIPAPNGFVPIPTATLTLTAALPTAPTETSTLSPAFAPTDTPPPLLTGTAEVMALEAEQPGPVQRDPNLFLPACGFALILAGILLFWMAMRARKRDRRRFGRFR